MMNQVFRMEFHSVLPHLFCPSSEMKLLRILLENNHTIFSGTFPPILNAPNLGADPQ